MDNLTKKNKVAIYTFGGALVALVILSAVFPTIEYAIGCLIGMGMWAYTYHVFGVWKDIADHLEDDSADFN